MGDRKRIRCCIKHSLSHQASTLSLALEMGPETEGSRSVCSVKINGSNVPHTKIPSWVLQASTSNFFHQYRNIPMRRVSQILQFIFSQRSLPGMMSRVKDQQNTFIKLLPCGPLILPLKHGKQ